MSAAGRHFIDIIFFRFRWDKTDFLRKLWFDANYFWKVWEDWHRVFEFLRNDFWIFSISCFLFEGVMRSLSCQARKFLGLIGFLKMIRFNQRKLKFLLLCLILALHFRANIKQVLWLVPGYHVCPLIIVTQVQLSRDYFQCVSFHSLFLVWNFSSPVLFISVIYFLYLLFFFFSLDGNWKKKLYGFWWL